MTITLQEIVRDETEFMFGNWGEGQGIGSSDISACVRNIHDTAARYGIDADDGIVSIRFMISDALSEMKESA